MNTDIRLSVGFWQHPKTKKTAKRLGLEGVRSLQVLWLWAAVNRPDGVLSGMDWEDIELAADWQGEERKFFECCLGSETASMWIDEAEGGYILHDWAENNPYVVEAEDRSDKARFSRLATVNRAEYERLKSTGVNAISKEDYDRLTTVKRMPDDRRTNVNAPPTPAPAPAPSPKPEEKNTNTPSSTENEGRARACDDPQGEFSDLSDTPGIEFQELRAFYDEHCRAEAPLTGFIEYKQLRASRRWPGISCICDAIDKHSRADPEGWKTFCPGLVKFLREHWWEKKPSARASPASKSGSPLSKNMETTAAVLAARQQRRQGP